MNGIENQDTDRRDRLAARASLGPGAMAGDYAAAALLQGQDPTAEIRSRIVGNRVDGYRAASPGTVYQPSAALKAKIAAMPASLQPYARQIAATGWDATDALEQAAAEGKELGRRVASGDTLPGDIAEMARTTANAIRIKHGLPLASYPEISFMKAAAETAHSLAEAHKLAAMLRATK